MSGSYSSKDGMTTMEWSMPEYTTADHWKCRLGAHLASRKLVVRGWLGFSQVGRYYCACGSRLWMWYEDGFVEETSGPPNMHLEWIETQETGGLV